MSQTSAVTINSGGQLVRENSGDISYGPANTVITLNGLGLAAFPGALRSGSNTTDQTLNMPVVLQSDTAINVVKPNDTATTRMIFANPVSGAGGLIVNARPGLPNRAGQLILQSANTYSGGTTIEQGSLYLDSAASTVGTGGVFVNGNITNPDSAFTTTGKLIIEVGVTNAIANAAYLNLTGGGTAGVADQGSIDIGSGVVEVVGGLMLGGVVYRPAPTAARTSTAMPTNPGLANPDEFFAGDGIITVVAAGVPGDYNNNGLVDAGDYVVWRKAARSQTTSRPESNDPITISGGPLRSHHKSRQRQRPGKRRSPESSTPRNCSVLPRYVPISHPRDHATVPEVHIRKNYSIFSSVVNRKQLRNSTGGFARSLIYVSQTGV